jgi:hypothetical protein
VYALRRTAGGVTRAHGSRHTTTLYTFSTLGGSEQGEKGAFKRNAKARKAHPPRGTERAAGGQRSTLGGSEQGEKGAFKRNAKGASPARNRASRGRYDYCKVVGCQ